MTMKPCPFCGSKEIEYRSTYFGCGESHGVMRCLECGCTVPTSEFGSHVKEPYAEWNRRFGKGEGEAMIEGESRVRPCPFCGKSPEVVVCDDEGNVRGEGYEQDSWSGLGYRIVHDSDECPIATDEEGFRNVYDTMEEAEEHWNRRSNECDREEILETLDKMVEESKRTSEYRIGDGLTIKRDGISESSARSYATWIREALGVE